MLHLKSISTIPIPPSNSALISLNGSLLTSHELVLEGFCVENFEALLGPQGEASLILVKADVQDLVLFLRSYH